VIASVCVSASELCRSILNQSLMRSDVLEPLFTESTTKELKRI